MKIVIEAQFLPPVSVFMCFAHAEMVYLEFNENYQKRSWRNRSAILNSNGEHIISVPLHKGKNQQQSIRHTKISYDQNWLKVLKTQLQSAYGKSAFFDYYHEELFMFFDHKFEYLFELNWELITFIMKVTGLSPKLEKTNDYYRTYPKGTCDLRNKWSPVSDGFKLEYDETMKYPQVFEYKFGFTPDLSIIDLLFNMGPEAITVLKNGDQALDQICK